MPNTPKTKEEVKKLELGDKVQVNGKGEILEIFGFEYHGDEQCECCEVKTSLRFIEELIWRKESSHRIMWYIKNYLLNL